MRIDRLELVTRAERVHLELHPGITLVTGLGRLEREALTAEVLGAIGAGRPGLSVDLIQDRGPMLEVHRPLHGPPTVREVVSGRDVTDRFLCGRSVDVLSTIGVPRHRVRDLLRMGRSGLRTTASTDQLVTRLAGLDQETLWDAALALADVEAELADAASETAPPDRQRELIELIEQRHAEVEIAADRLERTRRQALSLAITLALVAMIGAVLVHPAVAGPFVLGAMAAGLLSVWRWRELLAAADAEEELLARAGLSSYLGLQMVKVDRLTSPLGNRSQVLELAEIHRHALTTWQSLVGPDVSLEWVLEHRQAIENAAGEERAPMPDTDVGMVESMRTRFSQLLARFGQSLPVMLDDPFTQLDDFELAAALSILDDQSLFLQFVLMTEDPRVVGWGLHMAAEERAAVVRLGGQADTVDRPDPAPTPAPVPA